MAKRFFTESYETSYICPILGVFPKILIFDRFYKVFRVGRIAFSFYCKPNAFLILFDYFSANGTLAQFYHFDEKW